MDKHQLPVEDSYQIESNHPPNLADVMQQLLFESLVPSWHWHFTGRPGDLQPRFVWHRFLKATLKQISQSNMSAQLLCKWYLMPELSLKHTFGLQTQTATL